MFKNKTLNIGFVALLIVLSCVFSANAGTFGQEESLFNVGEKQPDINKIVTLKRIVNRGAKLYYLGERSGIHGWFVVKDGGIQVVYLSPDKKTVIIGGLLSEDGKNITNAQVKKLFEENPRIKEIISNSGKELDDIKKAGEKGGITSVPSDASSKKLAKTKTALPTILKAPGERLIQDLKAAAGVNLGKDVKARIYMIAAPSCPVCKATWREIKGMVSSGKLSVRLIPVYNNVGDKEKNQAAQLLLSKNPLASWNKFVAGNKSVLDGKASETAIKAIKNNLKLVTKWNIQGYPYLVYRGKDGRIKIVQGKPERMAAVLLDMSK